MKLFKAPKTPPDGYGPAICVLCKHVVISGSSKTYYCIREDAHKIWNPVKGIYKVQASPRRECESINKLGDCKDFVLYLSLNPWKRIKRFFNLKF